MALWKLVGQFHFFKRSPKAKANYKIILCTLYLLDNNTILILFALAFDLQYVTVKKNVVQFVLYFFHHIKDRLSAKLVKKNGQHSFMNNFAI